MEKKFSFYGTPLSKSSADHQTCSDGSFQNRRARLNYQQTVRDSQGRQRFHGAFTGGFSAGYFNTVDSIEGFQPRQFVSRRKSKHDDGTPNFSHKPEDYMDEEDFSEFGIAPKKIRVIGNYSNTDPGLSQILGTGSISIGETILRRLNQGLSSSRIRARTKLTFDAKIFPSKNDFHGLGYRPLNTQEVGSGCGSGSSYPLVAVLGGGKRLKISGEAFGSGIIDDDEGLMDAGSAYRYDHIGDYLSKPETSMRCKYVPIRDQPYVDDHGRGDRHLDLPGFILAKNPDATQFCDDILRYPKPIIPTDWIMPTRSKPYIPIPKQPTSGPSLDLHQSSSQFNKKFVQSSTKLGINMETKAGLVMYSDLKATETKLSDITQSSSSDEKAPTITRQSLEWRPCSLLCKRFNVPNPYPDNLSPCLKIPHLATHSDNEGKNVDHGEVYNAPAPMELKRSIFNIRFIDWNTDHICSTTMSTESEDEPQVIEIDERPPKPEDKNQSPDGDHDILEVSTAKKEPEVILLTSSSSSSPSISPGFRHGRLKETDDSTYGPPLPPSLKTSKKKKKKKKYKKHKKRHRCKSRNSK